MRAIQLSCWCNNYPYKKCIFLLHFIFYGPKDINQMVEPLRMSGHAQIHPSIPTEIVLLSLKKATGVLRQRKMGSPFVLHAKCLLLNQSINLCSIDHLKEAPIMHTVCINSMLCVTYFCDHVHYLPLSQFIFFLTCFFEVQ